MTTPSGFPRDLKSSSSTSSFPFERDRKGEASFPREHKRAFSEEAPSSSCSSSSSWQRDHKGDPFATLPGAYSLVDATAKRSRTEKRPLSLLDQGLIAAIREKQPLAASAELRSLDARIAKAITQKGIQISYPVQQEMVSEDLLSFCDTFFFSFPVPRDRDVHNYFMGRIIDLTFCSREVTPDPAFLQTFSEKIAEKVYRYTDTRIANIRKEVVEQEGGYGRKQLGAVRQEIRSLAERIDSFRKELFPTDTRPVLCEQNVALVKQALLMTEEQQYKEQYHAHALPGCQTKEEELPHILALGDLYLEKATAKRDKQITIQASGLYNYALRLVGKSANKYKLFHKMHKTGGLLFTLCTSNQVASCQIENVFKDNLRSNRQLLKKHRNTSEALVNGLTSNASPEEVRNVCRAITDTMKGFTCTLINQCLEQLGPPPCKYAIIGFGSLAREEMTPRSDLEFGILLENEHYRPYFRKLSYLLHFAVVNLGETILPCFNIPCLRKVGFHDRRIPRGFSFDGEGGGVDERGIATKGCKTPFGNRHTFHLIHTPEQMAAFQGRDAQGKYWVEKEPHLPMELIAHTLIMGEPRLVEEYRAALDKELARSYKEETMRSYLSTEHLYEGDVRRFDPSLGDIEKEGQLFEVKNDLYRLPHLLLDRFACFFGLTSLNTIDRVNELQTRGIFQPTAAKNVKGLVATTTKLRLQTYQFHQKQKGTMNAIAHQLGFTEQGGQFLLGEEALDQLQKVYQVLLPLDKQVHAFFRGDNRAFQKSIFWDDTPFTLGRIAVRLLQYEKAEKHYLQAKEKEPENGQILNDLGVVLGRLGKGTQAVANLEQALQIYKATYGERHPRVVASLDSLASAYQKGGQLGRAIPLFEEALQITRAAYGEQHPSVTIHLNNLALAYGDGEELRRAVPLLEQALEIDKATYGEQHPRVATGLGNLAVAYYKGGQWKRALPLFEKALRINKSIYGEQHPSIAIILGNLALAYQEGGQLKRALSLLKQALEIDKAMYGEQHPTVVIRLSNLALAYQEGGQLKRALPLLEQALEIDKTTYGEQHPTVATNLNNLASAYRQAGQLKRALPLLEQALEIDKTTYGEQHFCVARGLNNLAIAYKEVGQLKRALPLLEQALEIDKTTYGEQHPTVAANLNNLALVYQEGGQLKRALLLLEEAMRILKATYEEQHPRVAKGMISLAAAYQKGGQLERALPLFERALQTLKATYGKQHPIIAMALNNLALAYQKGGQLRCAVPLFEQALEVEKARYGEQHPNVVIRLNNLALAYQEDGQLKRAILLFEKVLSIDKSRYGEQHPQFATSLNNLGVAYLEGGQLKRALSLFEQALEIDKSTHEEQHPSVARDLNNLASAYQEAGQLKDSLLLFEEIVKINKATYGEQQHPDVAIGLNNLASVYHKDGQLKRALPLLEQALEIDKATYGEQHPHVAILLSNLALVYQEDGQLKRALPLLEQALEIGKAAYGERHPIVAIRLRELASAYQEGGELTRALPLLEQALEIDKATYGEQHPEVATSLNNLASVYLKEGQLKCALPLFKQAVQIDKATYGEQHPNVARGLNNLASVYYKEGQLKRAIPLFEQAVEIIEKCHGKEHPHTKIFRNNLDACRKASRTKKR